MSSLKRLLVSCLFLILPVVAAHAVLDIPEAARSSIPDPKIKAKSWVLMDHHSGWILASENADVRIEPASLTKIMTSYIVFKALENGELKLEDRTHISEKAWKTGGSRMFIDVNSEVDIESLLKGLIVQSGNDAAVALAEHIAGTEESFAELMNLESKKLGLTNTNFRNSTGWPAKNHYTSARDISILTSAMIREFPRYYAWYAEKEYTYNKIKQHNRNLLLWRDPSVDGVKTGHTKTAGYCLVGSADRDGSRMIVTVTGAAGPQSRAKAVSALLKYGFSAYETRLVYPADESATDVEVFMGSESVVKAGVGQDLYITVPKGKGRDLKAEIEVKEGVTAPIKSQQKLGDLRLSLSGKDVADFPLVALTDVAEGSIWTKITDTVRLWFK